MNRMAKYITATALLAGSAHAAPLLSTTATTTFHKTVINGVGVFYREAGPRNAPAIPALARLSVIRRASSIHSFLFWPHTIM